MLQYYKGTTLLSSVFVWKIDYVKGGRRSKERLKRTPVAVETETRKKLADFLLSGRPATDMQKTCK